MAGMSCWYLVGSRRILVTDVWLKNRHLRENAGLNSSVWVTSRRNWPLAWGDSNNFEPEREHVRAFSICMSWGRQMRDLAGKILFDKFYLIFFYLMSRLCNQDPAPEERIPVMRRLFFESYTLAAKSAWWWPASQTCAGWARCPRATISASDLHPN